VWKIAGKMTKKNDQEDIWNFKNASD